MADLLQSLVAPPKLDEQTPTSSPTPPDVMETPGHILELWQWVLIGSLVLFAVLAIVPLCITCLYRYRRRRTRQTPGGKDLWSYETMDNGGADGMELSVSQNASERESLVQKASRISFRSRGTVQSNPLTIGELERLLLTPISLSVEYASIPTSMATMSEIPAGAEEKNRYNDVLPNPHTRVALFLKFGVTNSDYINANFIRGYKGKPKAYIATQGPLPWTVVDFLRMVWEQKSSVIVMTTNLEERQRTKSAKYWPDERVNVKAVFDELEISIKRRKSTKEYTVTTFHLRHTEKMVSREITHLWFTAWPDHGVPEETRPVLNFLHEARKHMKEMQGPVVVHCSAGIGRTGVFIAADIGAQQLDETGEVDVLKIVSTMRQDRGGMVQTREQYVFLHEVLLEYATRSLGGRRSLSPQLLLEEFDEQDADN